MKYSVDLFGSHPSEDNDDCFCGQDFDCLADAVNYWRNPFVDSRACNYADAKHVAFVVLSGPDLYEVRANSLYEPATADVDDGDWQREFSRQAGMLGGIDAYNQSRGY